MQNLTEIIAEIKGQVKVLDVLERYNLNPKKEGRQYKCLCPFHQEKTPSFTVNISKNYYKCFGCDWSGDAIDFVKEYSKVDIKEACQELISIFSLGIEIKEATPKKQNKSTKPKTPKTEPKQINLPHLNLATFPKNYGITYPVSKTFTDKVSFAEKKQGIVAKRQTGYIYSDDPKIYKFKYEQLDKNGNRVPFSDGKLKHFAWYHDVSGYPENGVPKGFKLKPYKYPEAIEFSKNGIITVVEGEKDVETLRKLGIVAISFDNTDYSALKEIECDGFLIFADNDPAGIEKTNKIGNYCKLAKIPYLVANIGDIFLCAEDKADITDFYTWFVTEETEDISDPSDFIPYLMALIDIPDQKKNDDDQPIEESGPITDYSQNQDDNDEKIETKTLFTEKAFQDLYANKNYLAVETSAGVKLYKFKETHYHEMKLTTERKRIAKWLQAFDSNKLERSNVNKILEWALIKLDICPEKLNPKGINLKNGLLTVKWLESGEGIFEIEPHNPDQLYTYCSEVAFNPNADQAHCLKVLECLDPQELRIFLRTIALSFDLPYLRTKLGRPRALMLQGTGSNGKDALRTLVSTIFGHSMGGCSFGDFQQYDQGRKFPLSKLEGLLISWSSENAALSKLDKLQSLKAAISGDNLACEPKGVNEHEFSPKCVFLFNCNEQPQIKSDLEAIKTRWAILRFNKTYKMNPNKKLGELQADPRYKDDFEFIKKEIAPAFLNLLGKELEDLAITGIDFNPVSENFEALKRESCHLFQFCDDIGLGQDSQAKIYINDLWELLRNWYIENGTLEIEEMDKGKQKLTWHDQPNKYDRNVKAPNQVTQRFTELFPNVKRDRETVDLEKKGQFFLRGIGLTASLASLIGRERVIASLTASLSEATSEAITLDIQGSEASEAIYSILSENIGEKIKNFELDELTRISKLLIEEIERRKNSSPSIFEVGHTVVHKQRPWEHLAILAIEGTQIKVKHPYGIDWVQSDDLQHLDYKADN